MLTWLSHAIPVIKVLICLVGLILAIHRWIDVKLSQYWADLYISLLQINFMPHHISLVVFHASLAKDHTASNMLKIFTSW